MTTLVSTSNGVVLAEPTDTNPIVIKQGTTITDATGGENAITAYTGIWTIQNAGTVEAAGASGAAVYLVSGGTVTNQTTGVIGYASSDLSAIYIQDGAGTVTNFGLINAGVWLQSGGAVTNETGGRIISDSTSGGYGVGLHAGGAVTNAGTISGLFVGIDESEGGGTVLNELGGTITGHYAGVLLGFTDKAGPGGRYVTNQAGGTIIGYTGILAGGAIATVTNAGVIEGTVAGTFSAGGITLVLGAGVSMSPGGTVTNQSGGTIIGASYGIYIGGGTGTVFNAGSISSGGSNNSQAVKLLAGGYVSNAATGTISGVGGAGSAVLIRGAAGTVINAGSIGGGGTHVGISLLDGGFASNASTGTVSSVAGGAVYGGGAAETVVNAGLLVAPVRGIDIRAGGTVTNQSTGTITAASGAGVFVTGGAGGVINAGTILAGSSAAGIVLEAGGYVSNASGGMVSTPFANDIYITGDATVINAGLIETASTLHAAVNLAKTGYIGNASTGTIVSNHFGAANAFGGFTTVVNAGLITSTASSTVSTSDGVFLGQGGVVVNRPTGTIGGGANGILVTGGVGSVTTAGTIAGGIFAVNLPGGFANRLIIDPGAVFVGTVDGGNTIGATAVSTLELSSGASAGTLIGLGTKYIDFTQMTIDSGATWTLSSVPAGYVITDLGTLINDGAFTSPVTLGAGAVLTNATGGLIENATGAAVYSAGISSGVSVINQGSIAGGGSNGFGVELLGGGYVSNAATATIYSAQRHGIYIEGAAGTVFNTGVVMAAGTTASRGIVMLAGGYVSNSPTGTISSYGVGLFISGGVGTAVNAGHISSSGLHPAVDLSDGGTIINQLTGSLSSAIDNDIFITAGSGVVINAGLITAGGTHTAVDLLLGGYLSNAATGTIVSTGADAIYATGAVGTVINAGVLLSSLSSVVLFKTAGTLYNAGIIRDVQGPNAAVDLFSGGYVSNAVTGTISSSGHAGIYVTLGAGAVVNAGKILGPDGIQFKSSATVTNLATGTISGTTGIDIGGAAGTVLNAGSIGGNTDSVLFAGGFANRLIIDPGAVFNGTVSGGNTLGATAVSALELASGATAGTLSRLASKYVDFGQIIVDSGATWVLAGSNTLTAGITLTDNGTLAVPGSLANYGMIAGAVTLDAGAVLTNAVGGVIDNTAGIAIYSAVTSAGVSVINAGSIAGFGTTGCGIELVGGGLVSNAETGTIYSAQHNAINIASAAGTVLNAGVIITSGGTHAALSLQMGGFASNAGAGTISSSGGVGLYIGGATGTALNAGIIQSTGTGTNAIGLFLAQGGVATNEASGTVTGIWGVGFMGAAGTLINYGSIVSSTTHSAAFLDAGGRVTNTAGALVQSTGGTGIYATSSSVVITNAGTVVGGSDAVALESGGYVNNALGGTIVGTAFSGIIIRGGAGTVLNAGLIGSTGTSGNGVNFQSGGFVSNAVTGTLTAIQYSGLYIRGGTGTVVNDGLIAATGSGADVVGLFLAQGGAVTNEASGTLTGNWGFGANGASATLDNYGTILSNTTHSAAFFDRGGQLTNAIGAIIHSPGGTGVYVTGASAAIFNAGTITSGTVNGSGIVLEAGGYVNDAVSGVINGALFDGIYAIHSAATVTNAGLIESTGTRGNGIGLVNGGFVSNASTGTIISQVFSAIAILGGPGTIQNSGRIITSTQNDGVYLTEGGGLTNSASGTISGDQRAIRASGAPTNIWNAGLLHGNTSGIGLRSGGSITNVAGGTISTSSFLSSSFRYGVYISGGAGTVVNAGLVGAPGSASYAVDFGSGFTNRLVVDPGASFVGTVSGGNSIGATVVSTLELASAGSVGTLSGLGSKYIDFAQTTIDAGASWALTGANTIVSGATLTELAGANLTDASTLENDGAILLDPSTMTVAGLTGTGSVTIEAGSTLDVQGTIANAETVVFGGSGAYLHLENPDSASGGITNFDVGETLDLKGVDFGSVRYADGLLSFSGAVAPGLIFLSLAGGNTGVVSTPSGDGSEIFVLCFCVNTQILTPSGERPVQDLAAGDLVTTHRGEARPIVWLGIGKVLATRGRRTAATPVIVRKNALADNVPNRDLRVTKGHAFHLDGVLIPVEFLVNHRLIEWDDRAQEVELYQHRTRHP